MYAKQVIFVALGLASFAVASPVPGLFDHVVCDKLLNALVDDLQVAIDDVGLINGGASSQQAITLLNGAETTVDDIWEPLNKVTKSLDRGQVLGVSSNLDTVKGLLTGVDAQTKKALGSVITAKAQVDLVPSMCEMSDD